MHWQLPMNLRDDPSSQHYLREQGLTDGLPVIIPTTDRIASALATLGLTPQTPMGTMPPFQTPCTSSDLMAQVIMAGARPQDMPLVQAAVAARSYHPIFKHILPTKVGLKRFTRS